MNRKSLRRGQAIVEMAFLLPFFLLIIVGGIIDFGFAFYNLIALQQIADDVAQYAAEGNAGQPPSPASAVTDYAQQRKPSWWAGPLTVTVTNKVTSDAGARPLKEVVVQYTSPMYTPFYQTAANWVTGTDGLKLVALAAFQVPQF